MTSPQVLPTVVVKSLATLSSPPTMSKYASYVDLTKRTTEYARRMSRLSDRIFGEVVRPTNSKSRKVVELFSVQPRHLQREMTHYYPRHIEIDLMMSKLREYGLYRDEHADFQEEMKRMRELRGKVDWLDKMKRKKRGEEEAS